MNYLSAEQVLFIHARVVAEAGGSHGVRDLGLLEAAVGLPQATFEGQNLYPDLFMKAAALMHALLKNHPFLDGNKRTGLAATAIFLRRNGWRLGAKDAELEAKILRVATQKTDLDELAEWLHANSIKTK